MLSNSDSLKGTELMLQEAVGVLSEARKGLAKYRKIVESVLGENDEEREETWRLIKGLSTSEVREALTEYRRRHRIMLVAEAVQ